MVEPFFAFCGKLLLSKRFFRKKEFRMPFTVQEDGDVAIVIIDGEVTSSNSNDLQVLLEEVKGQGYTKIIFDLEKLLYICSLGIGVLARTCGELKKAHGAMAVHSPSEDVRKLLKLLRLDKIIPVASNRSEAIDICS